MRQWLRDAREKQNLSESGVAVRVGITQAAYHMIEAETRNPKPATAKKISAVLGVPWMRFYEEETETEEEESECTEG